MEDSGEKIVSLATLSEAQKKVLDLREEKLELDKKVKILSASIDEAERRLLTLLKEAGMKSFKTSYGMVSIVQKFNVRLPDSQENWSKFFDYLQKTGHYEAMRTVNSQRLNGWYNQELEAIKVRSDLTDDEKMNWSPPGLAPPKLFEDLSFRK